MGIVEDLGADGGADLHVFDLIQGYLDPSVGGKESVDLTVHTVLRDKDQRTDPGDQGCGKSKKGNDPEAESQKADQASDSGRIVRKKIQESHAAGDDQICQYRHQRRTKVKENGVVFITSFFNGLKAHGDHTPPEMEGVRTWFQSSLYFFSYSSEV